MEIVTNATDVRIKEVPLCDSELHFSMYAFEHLMV